MCQGCVDHGFLKQETLNAIDAFCEKWPDSEFGPAHIVLSDANIEDEQIDWCLALLRSVLANDQEAFSVAWPGQTIRLYEDEKDDELKATIKFLEELRKIPESER